MKLLISEKKNTATPVAKIVGASRLVTSGGDKRFGYYEGNGWIVTWCRGHLIQFAEPASYNPVYKRWSLEDLPILPEKWKYVPNGSEPAKQLAEIKKIFSDYDIEEIYHAGDSDREGELIVRELLSYLGKEKIPTKRIWYNNNTDEAIKKALKEARPLSDYEDLAQAALLRAQFDWIYGINLSRAYTVYAHSTRNVGRVISASIQLIVKKQEEIDAFISEDYGVVTAQLKKNEDDFNVTAKYSDLNKAKQVTELIKGKNATIVSVEKNRESSLRILFDLTSLQAEAAKRFGYSAKETSDIAQKLYENGWQSYPRTLSDSINEEQVSETEPLLVKAWEHVFACPGTIDTSDFDIQRIVHKKGKGAEASHTGLCPTMHGLEDYKTKIKPDAKLRNIFLLVTQRLLCSCLPPRIVEKTKVIADIEKELFSVTGTVEIDPGFLSFEKYVLNAISLKKGKTSSTVTLPVLNEGDICPVLKASMQAKKTAPPKPYTLEALLLTMKNISNVLPEKKMKEVLKQASAGLGTPSSRDTIIETMVKNGFVEIKKDYFYPTEKAKDLMSLLPEDLKSPVMTANMEIALDDVARGIGDPKQLMADIILIVEEQVDAVRKLPPIPDTARYKDNKTLVPKGCPKCGNDVVDDKKFAVCRCNCGFILWKTIAKKKLIQAEIKSLVSNGHSTAKLDGFMSKKGQEFSCWIYLDADCKTTFDFSDDGATAKTKNFISMKKAQES